MNKFFVYVVELRPHPSQGYEITRDVYVGSTALSPEVRFQKHKTSPKSSRHVRKRGIRLLPRLYDHLNPLYSRERAKATEQHLRKSLERQGYKVYGSCSPRQTPECWL